MDKVFVFWILSMYWNSIGGKPVISVPSPGNYSEQLTLTCTDSTYIIGKGYFWYKSTTTIYDRNGELVTNGKYTSRELNGTFQLIIQNLEVSDEGTYKCNQNFLDSDVVDVKVESVAKAATTDGKCEKGYLFLSSKKVYPTSAFEVYSQNQELTGTSNCTANGDLYDCTWQSKLAKASGLSSVRVSLTGYTNYSLGSVVVKGSELLENQWVILNGIGMAAVTLIIITALVVLCALPKNIGPALQQVVIGKLRKIDIVLMAMEAAICSTFLGVGIKGLIEWNTNCDKCDTYCGCDLEKCNACKGLSGTSIALACTGLVIVTVVYLIQAKEIKLPCMRDGDKDERGRPDGGARTPTAPEKHSETLLMHNRTTHRDDQPRARPQPAPPSSNDRPMPAIPADKANRGLSANFEDPHRMPGVDITLPHAGKSKNTLDPLGERVADADDQERKKKKKKKKDRETSRSEEFDS